jgi:predicted MPP superfamily phosphohydrolase
VGGTSIAFAGVDDPHLKYDDLERVAGPADPTADLRLAVSHAPYLRVLDQFAHDGYDAVLAGHTHGGQVCLPFVGALTTNCDLDTARAKGVHRHPADSRPGDPGSTWLHVSAGLGTSPYVRLRLACRPEATLLTLTARPA